MTLSQTAPQPTLDSLLEQLSSGNLLDADTAGWLCHSHLAAPGNSLAGKVYRAGNGRFFSVPTIRVNLS